MGFFKKLGKKVGKHLTKVHNVTNPAHKYLKKATGGRELDPLNLTAGYRTPPKTPPYVRPPAKGLTPNPGTGGPTRDFGGNTGGRNYVNNPFISGALRTPPPAGGMGGPPPPQMGMGGPGGLPGPTPPPMASPPMGAAPMQQGPMGGPQVGGSFDLMPFDPGGGMQMQIPPRGGMMF